MFGNNSYGYGGYGYNSNPFDQLLGFGSAFGVLMFIAFIAAIVLTVMGYKRFVSDKNELHLSFKDKESWGPFLRFDILLIDKILKALYIFCAIFTALFFLAIVLASLVDGIVAFLVSLIMCAILCLITELLERVTFESVMLSVIVTRNTNDIKEMLRNRPASQLPPAEADPVPPVEPVAPAEKAPEPPAPKASAPQPPEPEPAEAPEAPEPSEPTPHAPSFCPECGTPVEPGSHFCRECGTKLD